MRPNSDDLDENFKPKKQKNFSFRAGGQTSTTKNIERQMVSVGDPISQKNDVVTDVLVIVHGHYTVGEQTTGIQSRSLRAKKKWSNLVEIIIIGFLENMFSAKIFEKDFEFNLVRILFSESSIAI